MNDDELECLIRKTLKNATIVLGFSLILCVISLIADIYSANNDRIFWFQRSGAIAVLFAAAVEYWFSSIRHDINPPSSSYVADERWRNEYGARFNVLSKIAISFMVCGTFVWGYGDLIFKSA